MQNVSEVAGKQPGRQIPEPSNLAGIRKEMERASRETANGALEDTGGNAGTKPTSSMEKSAWMGAPVKVGSFPSTETVPVPPAETVNETSGRPHSPEHDQDADCLGEKLAAVRRQLAEGRVPWEKAPSSERAVKNASTGAVKENGAVTKSDSCTGAPTLQELLEIGCEPTRRQDSAPEYVRGAEIHSAESSLEPAENRPISIPSDLLAVWTNRAQRICQGRHTGVSHAYVAQTGDRREAYKRPSALLLGVLPEKAIEKGVGVQVYKNSPPDKKNGRGSGRGPPG